MIFHDSNIYVICHHSNSHVLGIAACLYMTGSGVACRAVHCSAVQCTDEHMFPSSCGGVFYLCTIEVLACMFAATVDTQLKVGCTKVGYCM
jgi:hypothetical protein